MEGFQMRVTVDGSLTGQIQNAVLFHDFVIAEWPQGGFPGTLRNRLFTAFVDIALEHYGAILTLLQTQQHYASALALLRPLMETTCRGFWLIYCATDEQIEQIARSIQQFPALTTCLKALERYFSVHGHKGLFAASKESLNQLHGLTHSGLEQLQFRFNSDRTLKPNYPDAVVGKLVRQSSQWLVFIALANIQLVEGKNDSLAPRTSLLTDRFLELFEKE